MAGPCCTDHSIPLHSLPHTCTQHSLRSSHLYPIPCSHVVSLALFLSFHSSHSTIFFTLIIAFHFSHSTSTLSHAPNSFFVTLTCSLISPLIHSALITPLYSPSHVHLFFTAALSSHILITLQHLHSLLCIDFQPLPAFLAFLSSSSSSTTASIPTSSPYMPFPSPSHA